jgi:hypothetical protein
VISKTALGNARKLWAHNYGDLEGYLCISTAIRNLDDDGVPIKKGNNATREFTDKFFHYPEEVEEALAYAHKVNSVPLHEVWCSKTPFKTMRRGNDNVVGCGALAVELDGPPLPDGKLKPTAVVLSSPAHLNDDGKDHFHPSFAIDPSTPIDRAGELNRRLGKKLGGEKIELSGLLRIPGTINWKHPEEPVAELLYLDDSRRFDEHALDAMLPEEEKREHTSSAMVEDEPPVPLSGYALEVWEGKHRVQGDDGDYRYGSLFHILATTCEVLAQREMNPEYARSVLIDAAANRDYAIDWRDGMGEYKGLKTEKRDADVYYEKLADEVIEKKLGEGEFMKSESNGNGPVGNEAGSLASLEVPPSPNGSGAEGLSPGGRGAAVKPTDGEPDIEEIRRLFWTPKDVYERAGEKDTPVVPGFLYEGFMVDLAGEAGSGKTTFLMAMVKAILTGGYFLGRPCQKSPVVNLSEQAETIVTAMEKIGLNSEHEGLYVLPHKNVDDLTWEETYTKVRRMAKGVGAKAIFTDTIDDFGGLESDQSSNDGDVRKLLKLPKAAAQVDGLAVLNVRQMNKMGKGKGSVEFDHSPDIVRGLYILPNGPENAREIRTIKSRTREELPRKQTVELREGIYHSLGSATKVQEHHARNAALSILKKQEHTRIRKSTLVERVTSEAQVSEATAKRALGKMEEDREIRVDTVKGQGNPQVCVLISEETLLPNPLRIPDEDVL